MNEMQSLNTIECAINNLELLSSVLEKCANTQALYNSDFGYYLEQMSWEMHRMASETKKRKILFAGI